MKKLWLVCLLFLLSTPAHAGASLLGVDGWIYVNSTTLELTRGGTPVVLVKLLGFLYATSSVQLLSDYFLMEFGSILIDGVQVTVTQATPL